MHGNVKCTSKTNYLTNLFSLVLKILNEQTKRNKINSKKDFKKKRIQKKSKYIFHKWINA